MGFACEGKQTQAIAAVLIVTERHTTDWSGQPEGTGSLSKHDPIDLCDETDDEIRGDARLPQASTSAKATEAIDVNSDASSATNDEDDSASELLQDLSKKMDALEKKLERTKKRKDQNEHRSESSKKIKKELASKKHPTGADQ